MKGERERGKEERRRNGEEEGEEERKEERGMRTEIRKEKEEGRERGRKEGGAGQSGDGSGTAGAKSSKIPKTHSPTPPPAPLPGHLSVSAPSSVLSGGTWGSRLAGPCGGRSPSSSGVSTPAGVVGEQGWLGGPCSSETPTLKPLFPPWSGGWGTKAIQCVADTKWLVYTSMGMERWKEL